MSNYQLYLRRLDEAEARPIQGSQSTSVHTPFFSPDGRWVAFDTADGLKKIPVNGGVAVAIGPRNVNFGADWYAPAEILFATQDGVFRVPAGGGAPQQLIAIKPGETIFAPRMLPDGDHVSFTVTTVVGSERWNQAQIVVQSLSSGDRQILLTGGADARYVTTGHLVYAVGTTVFAAPFDVAALRVVGAPVAVERGVARAIVPAVNTGAANFAIASNGTLAYLPEAPRFQGNLALVDLTGRIDPLPFTNHSRPRISANGAEVVLESDNALWVHSLVRQVAPRKLTLEGVNSHPIWTPDSAWITFSSVRAAGTGLYRQRADGSGAAEPLLVPLTEAVPVFWSHDGSTLFYAKDGAKDAQVWSFKPGEAPRAVFSGLAGAGGLNASLSPDGRWIAFHARENGRMVPYIQSLERPGARCAVTKDGGHHPLWSPDGRRLFFVANDSQRLLAVDVVTQPTVSFSEPVGVLDAVVQTLATNRNFDVTPDGKRLLAFVPDAQSASEAGQVEVVLNWFEELKARVLTGR